MELKLCTGQVRVKKQQVLIAPNGIETPSRLNITARIKIVLIAPNGIETRYFQFFS